MEEDSAEIHNLAKSTSADFFFFLGSLTYLDLESSRRLGKLATDHLQFDSENCYTSDPDNILEFSKMARDPQRYLVIQVQSAPPLLPRRTLLVRSHIPVIPWRCSFLPPRLHQKPSGIRASTGQGGLSQAHHGAPNCPPLCEAAHLAPPHLHGPFSQSFISVSGEPGLWCGANLASDS